MSINIAGYYKENTWQVKVRCQIPLKTIIEVAQTKVIKKCLPTNALSVYLPKKMVKQRYGTECCQLSRVQIYSGRAFTELRQDCHQNVVWVILCRRLSIQKDWYLRHALNLSGQYQSCSVTCKNCPIRHRTFC